MTNFNVGDIVKKRYGSKLATIVFIRSDLTRYGDDIQCRYHKSNQSFWVSARDIIPANPDEIDQTESTPMKTLYSFKKEDGSTGYGNHIGTNSSNQYLIEEKTTGQIHVLDKNQLEEVLPYTFSALINGKETHFIGTPGTLVKGDLLLYTGTGTAIPQIAVVTNVDTKEKTARAKFKGRKLVTEEI